MNYNSQIITELKSFTQSNTLFKPIAFFFFELAIITIV
jgi:hypothetical protein